MIHHLTICGGTHGNERVGSALLDQWIQHPEPVTYPTFKTELLLANKLAVHENKRFLEHDLNRCFLLADLKNVALSSYEQKRAKEIYDKIAFKTDLILDLHTTTSHMGMTFIIEYPNVYTLQLAASVQALFPEIKILLSNFPEETELPYLYSICKRGILIEVGPIPQGTLTQELYQKTKIITETCVEHIQLMNEKVLSVPSYLDVYVPFKDVFYPEIEGKRSAMVHSRLQGNDYKPLKNGDPIFYGFNGELIRYSGETVYPVFINEAAYDAQSIAFQLTKKQRISLKGTL